MLHLSRNRNLFGAVAASFLGLGSLEGTPAVAENNNHVLHQPTFGAASTVRKGKSSKSEVPPYPIREVSDLSSLILLTGTSHQSLSKQVSDLIGVPVANSQISRFPDGEVSVQVNDSLRGNDVFILQSCAAPVNDSIMELLLTVSCARRAGAKRVIAIIPYFGYKHHRRGSALSTKYQSRFLSSGAMDFAKMLQEMGVDRVISVDLQRPGQGQEACFFDTGVPLEVVLSESEMVNHIVSKVKLANRVVVVSPNTEGFKKARKFQTGLHKHLSSSGSIIQLATFISSNTGSGPTDTTKLELLGENVNLSGADVIIVDDMVDTAGTLGDISMLMKKNGALNIYVAASHGLFTENSMDIIEKSPVTKVFVTDSLPLPVHVSNKVEQVSIARQLGHIILAEYFRTLSTAKEEQFLVAWEDELDEIE